AARKALWTDAQRLYATELPSLPLYFRSDVFILPKWLTGIRPTGNQSPSTLWITDWSVQPWSDDPFCCDTARRDPGDARADVFRHLCADRPDAGRSDRSNALGRPAHERGRRGPA